MEDPSRTGRDRFDGGFLVTALKLHKLQRDVGRDKFGKPRREILHGSTRSTQEACEQLAAQELERTGIEWKVVRA